MEPENVLILLFGVFLLATSVVIIWMAFTA